MKYKCLYTLFLLLLILPIKKVASQKTAFTQALDADMERASLLMPWDNAGKRIKENLFVKVIANKKACYVGEPLLVTYKLFTRLQSHSKVVDAPTFNGCSVIEMTTNNLEEEKEIVGGKLYKTFVLRKVQLIPLQEGILPLGQVVVDNVVTLYQGTNGNYNNLQKQIQLKNIPLEIQIKQLPVDASKNQSGGGIGKFFLMAKVTKSVDTTNDNNTLELIITGTGNFMNMTCPLVQWPASMLAYEPKVIETLDKLSFPVLGEKKFVIPFTCKQQGEFKIPSISFTYFDADSGKYSSTSTAPITLTVLPAVPLIDPEKLTVGITNLNYLWIIPGIAAIVGLVMVYSTKNNKAIAESEPVKKRENNTILEATRLLFRERLGSIYHCTGTMFYKDSRELANDIKEEINSDEGLKTLEEVILMCNDALYGHKEVDRELIIAGLRQGIMRL